MITEEQLAVVRKSLLPGMVRPSYAVYLNNIIRGNRNYFCAEIGLSAGINAEAMLRLCDKTKFVLVDDYSSSVEYPGAKQEAIDRLEKYGDRVVLDFGDGNQ